MGSMSTVDDPRVPLEFLQGTLEVLILRSLQLGPNHAYGITRFLEQQSGDEFTVDNGSLYPALQRLLQRDWITAQWKTSPNGRRAKYYRLTPAGRKQLVAATSKWERFVEAMRRVLEAQRGAPFRAAIKERNSAELTAARGAPFCANSSKG